MPFLLQFFACEDPKCIEAPDVSSIEVSVKIERLDKKLHKIPTKNELSELLEQNEMFADKFLDISQYPSYEIWVDRYFKRLNIKSIDSLFIEVENTFGDL